jgi:hypothetical protein
MIVVDGAATLTAGLRDLGPQLDDMADVSADVAGIIAGATRPPRRSGALAGSVRSSARGRLAVVEVGSGSVPYAGVQEWGWRAHHNTARAYLQRAAHGTEPAWSARITAGVRDRVDQLKGA